MIFDKVHLLFRIRILHKVSDPYGSGSTTLVFMIFSILLEEFFIN
jgi:hypothetical protein